MVELCKAVCGVLGSKEPIEQPMSSYTHDEGGLIDVRAAKDIKGVYFPFGVWVVLSTKWSPHNVRVRSQRTVMSGGR